MWVSRVAALRALVHSGVHGEHWPKHVYGVAMYAYFTDKDYIMAKNTKNKVHAKNGTTGKKTRKNLHAEDGITGKKTRKNLHAEDDILDYFNVLLEDNTLRTPQITLFLSSSPCPYCSQNIITFLSTARDRGIDLEIEVVISAFYKIIRPSCEKNPACQGHLPSRKDHRAQIEGLMKLSGTPGVVLRTTTNKDWENLAVTLDLDDIDLSGREKIDDLLEKDFRQLMSDNYPLPQIVSPPETSVNLSVDQSDESLSTEPSHLTLTTDPS